MYTQLLVSKESVFLMLNQDLVGNISPLFTENNLTLSASSIEAYGSCPFKFKLDRMRVPGKNKSYLDLGSSIHIAIKEISKHKISGKKVTDAFHLLEKKKF